MTDTRIRLADADDAERVLAIYAPVVLHTPTSFEAEVPTITEVKRRIEVAADFAPWLVCERGDEVLGYAYATKHRERAAYQWAVEVSVYVQERTRRTGVGRALYKSLLECLTVQGFHTAYAVISLPNASSVGLHEQFGFRLVGVFPKAGFKLGAWHDVGWWRLELRPYSANPQPPKKLSEVLQSTAWRNALGRGEVLLSASPAVT